MDTRLAIESRRAVKRFDPEFEISREEVDSLLRLALLSPTAFNIQHWRFLMVRDSNLRRQIRSAAWDQAQVTDASLLIVLCADLKAWEKQPERYWRNAPADARAFLLQAMHNYYSDKPQVQRDEAMRSCGIAAQTLMLAAKAMGYDSCPMDGFDFEQVGHLIALPEDYAISMFVAIGKALEPAQARGGQLSLDEVVAIDRFA
ncbi:MULTISPECIES: nitroreductase family protein [Methylomonas]|uniref:nitroreductase family protein n=1 Tax=Methylomonas TaxID=416 RepID=UPI001232B8DA|nr:nitroreductase family protein [Methylomonas rhizoryzae]